MKQLWPGIFFLTAISCNKPSLHSVLHNTWPRVVSLAAGRPLKSDKQAVNKDAMCTMSVLDTFGNMFSTDSATTLCPVGNTETVAASLYCNQTGNTKLEAANTYTRTTELPRVIMIFNK